MLRLWAKAHSAASPFLQLHPEAEPADQAGRLNPTRRAPLGPNAGEILPPSQIWTSNVAWHQLLDLPVQHALLNDVDTQAPHTHVHTHTDTPFSRADSKVLRVMLLNSSPSFYSMVLPLSWQKPAWTSPASYYPLAGSLLPSPYCQCSSPVFYSASLTIYFSLPLSGLSSS